MTRIALIVGAVALTGVLFTALYIRAIQERADLAEKELDAVSGDLNRFREIIQKQAGDIEMLGENIECLQKSVQFYDKKSEEIEQDFIGSINEVNSIDDEPNGSDWLDSAVPNIVCEHVKKRMCGTADKNNTLKTASLDALHEADGYADLD